MDDSCAGPMLRGILFDLGDTLIDFGAINPDAMFRLGARAAYVYLQQLGCDLPSWRRYHWHHWLAIRWHAVKAKLRRKEFHSLPVLLKCCRRFGIHLTTEQQLELCWQFYRPLREQSSVETGLGDMLASLREAGLELAVVSNTFVPGEILDRHLRKEGLIEYFPIRVYSCDVGVRKPHPAMFRRALEATGLEASEVLFIGDTPAADIEGARRMGIATVLKDPTGRRRGAARADHRIRRIMDLPDVLKRYRIGGRP